MTDHTYDALVGSLELESKSLARYWLRDMPDPSWDEPSEFGQLVTPSTQNSAAALLLRQALADVPAYNLTVMNGEVLVLYKLAETFELNAQGGRYLAFAGDYASVTVGSEITLAPPGFVELHGSTSRAATARNFETREVPILEWDGIRTALDGNATIALVDRAVAPPADPNAAAGAAAPVVPTSDVHHTNISSVQNTRKSTHQTLLCFRREYDESCFDDSCLGSSSRRALDRRAEKAVSRSPSFAYARTSRIPYVLLPLYLKSLF